MEVVVHNGIERCPQQCTQADIRVWKELQYGVRKASIVGVETFVTCAHASVCKKLIEQQSEAKS